MDSLTDGNSEGKDTSSLTNVTPSVDYFHKTTTGSLCAGIST